MLISGRGIQGVGSGGINLLVEMIVSDLVPSRERGKYMAIILTVFLVGTALGPFAGGYIVQHGDWRWVFWMTVPIGIAANILLFFFLRVKVPAKETAIHRFKRIDYGGNLLLMGASVAILYALTYGGASLPWNDARVIIALTVGLLGMVFFGGFEAWLGRKTGTDPVVPTRLFISRTGVVLGINTFINSMLVNWAMFFLPVYFQGVKQLSPSETGVQMLPVLLVSVPGAIIAGILVSRFGKYKLLHISGFALISIGMGLLSIMGPASPPAMWIIFQIIAALGSGLVLNTQLPAFQAVVPESDQASATATWAFVRSLGNIWGVSIPAAVFNSRFEAVAGEILDPAVRTQLGSGKAFEHANQEFLSSILNVATRKQTANAFSEALHPVWALAGAFAAIAAVLALIEKEIPLRTELETEFGLASRDNLPSTVCPPANSDDVALDRRSDSSK